MVVRWKSDFDKYCVVSNFDRRGWQEIESESDAWDIYWASVQAVWRIFQPDSGIRLDPGQLINHFPNHNEITRKDHLVKNLKRYQKSGRKDGEPVFDFLPATYILPNDHPLFVEEFKRHTNATWIMKPAGRAQGRGIFLINKLSQVKRWEKPIATPNKNATGTPTKSVAQEVYVVSKYIDNPLLIGGKKFDLRLYALVPSFKPLKVYLSELGFARFCNVKYDFEDVDLDNKYMHLTNVAVQKHCEDYNGVHGNKWPLAKLRLWLEGIIGMQSSKQLFLEIEQIVVQSLKACQNVIINDRHCFELYGYDIIIDENLAPWLIEVNASPSLAASTKADRLLKAKVINDTLNIVAPPEWAAGHATQTRPRWQDWRGWGGMQGETPDRCDRAVSPTQSGSMRLLYDETAELELRRAARDEQLTDTRARRRFTSLSFY